MCEAMGFAAAVAEGVRSAGSIAMLLAADPEPLRRDDAIAAVIGLERARRLLEAAQVRMIAKAAGRAPLAGTAIDEAAAEISAALNVHFRQRSSRRIPTVLPCSAPF